MAIDTGPADEIEFRVLVNSRSHDDDLLSLARCLSQAPEFVGRIRVLGRLPEDGGSFDILTAAIAFTVPSDQFEETTKRFAEVITLWHTRRAKSHLKRGELSAPAVVTLIFPSGATVATECD